MDDQEKAAADAMILLNMQVEERVLNALANALVGDDMLRSRIVNSTPEGVIRGAIAVMIVDVLRSPEFKSVLWAELQKSLVNTPPGPRAFQSAVAINQMASTYDPTSGPFGLPVSGKTW